MLQKRLGQDHDETTEFGGTAAAAETLRVAAAPPAGGHHPPEKKEEEKMSLFWRVFGGTILSIVALVAITLFNNLNGGINDLRNDINREREARAGLAKKEDLDREREARAGLAKKEDMDSRIKTQYERIRAVEGQKADIETVRERVNANGAAVEAIKKDLVLSVDQLKKDTAGLDLLKERVTAVEAVRKDIAAIDALKEKVAALAADVKTEREEVQKVQAELDKNKAADLERKTFRDSQAKQLDDTIKELQRGIQDCREKLARLEGAQPNNGPAPKPAAPGGAGKQEPTAEKPAPPVNPEQ